MLHPTFRYPDHRGCAVCDGFARYRAERHALNLAQIWAVAASLPPLSASARQSALEEKQETPGVGAPEVSTLVSPDAAERRAAGDQSGTGEAS
jgi:hypothetical protein